MVDFSKLISLPLDMNAPPDISNVLDSVYDMIYDNYRDSTLIMLMLQNGEWEPVASRIPEFVEWAETELFTWTERSQMVVITTPTKKAMAPHIDCSPSKFNTLQHKFRYVFRGNVTDLRWYESEKFVHNIDTDKPYIISGKWPHDMINTHNKTKYTLCLGAPWEASLDNPEYYEMLQKSYMKYSDKMMSFEDWNLPSNWRELFNQERYGIPHELNLIR